VAGDLAGLRAQILPDHRTGPAIDPQRPELASVGLAAVLDVREFREPDLAEGRYVTPAGFRNTGSDLYGRRLRVLSRAANRWHEQHRERDR